MGNVSIDVNPVVKMLIRTEASPDIGHGHVMRCCALADAARDHSIKVFFQSSDSYTDNLLETMGEQLVPADDMTWSPQWIVRDYREGSSKAEVALEVEQGSVVLLFDDLGPARLEASVVTDALMTKARSERYPHSARTQYLYGLEYVPLRRQFSTMAASARPGLQASGRLFVSFGGGDLSTVTHRYIEALNQVGFRGPASIISNGANNIRVLKQLTLSWENTDIFDSLPNMAAEMSKCDLVASKLGITQLEAFSLGLGCILIEPTVAHETISRELEKTYQPWPAVEFGIASEIDFTVAATQTIKRLKNQQWLKEQGKCGAELVNGTGAKEIVQVLLDTANGSLSHLDCMTTE